MNILTCNQNYHVKGGSDIYFLALNRLLENDGHLVIPFASNAKKNQSPPGEKYFPNTSDFERANLIDLTNYIYNLNAKNKLELLLAENKIDLAHLHIYYGKLTSSILKPLTVRGIPIVQTLHEYKLVCPVYTMFSDQTVCYDCNNNKMFNALVKKCNRNSLSRSLLSTVESYASIALGSQNKIDKFIAVSDFQKEQIIRMGGKRNKITTIHNYIETEGYCEHGQGDYFLYFGRVEEVKGIQVLIEGFKELRHIKLFIAGDGSYLTKAMQYCMEENIRNITFLGHLSKTQLLPYLSSCIASITPSLWAETFGLTLLESFACNKPVIASNIGGMTEIIIDKLNGFLIKPSDVGELKEKVIFLNNNRDTARKMGVAGRHHLEVAFSKEVHLRKLKDVYKEFTD
jgi:glycosyltransferase involved in cell wall biosynthesis